MLVQAREKVGGNAGVERAVPAAGKDVHARLPFHAIPRSVYIVIPAKAGIQTR
jgi:hypothetical protein